MAALLALLIAVLLLNRAHRGVVILHYHAVNCATGPERAISIRPQDLVWQMKHLKRAGYSVVTLEQAVAYLKTGDRLPPKPVAITFDDGYQDNYEHVYPILKGMGLPATIFMPTGEIGGINRWDIHRGYSELRLLNWTQIEEMQKGNIDFMPHSVNHVNLTRLEEPELYSEITESKAVLERRLGEGKHFFAYPYGSLNQRVVEALIEAGYQAAFTSSPGTNVVGRADLFRIRRMPIKESHCGLWGRLMFLWDLKMNSLRPH